MFKKIIRKTNDVKIYIFSGVDPSRYAFYFDGLQKCFPESKIIYTVKTFPKFHSHCMPIILGDKPGIKIYISTGDGSGFNDKGLVWADVYVKRTILTEKMPQELSSKIIPGGPHIETRAWGFIKTVDQAIRSFHAGGYLMRDVARHFKQYMQQYFFRLPEQSYNPGIVHDGYVFYAATLYPTHPGYNRYRATFIQACQETPGVTFEGGLIRKDDFRVPEYQEITITKYYPMSKWLANVKRSMLGFWAPGDQGAMTLKMAEFMACGKAIIAVPIRTEQLPAPLVHGEHVHFVDGSLEEMKAAVRLLTTDHEYRQKLERNARAYYEQWVAPEQAMRRFIREGAKRMGVTYEDL